MYDHDLEKIIKAFWYSEAGEYLLREDIKKYKAKWKTNREIYYALFEYLKTTC